MTLQEFQSTVMDPGYWMVNLGAMTGNGLSEFAKQLLQDAFVVTDPTGLLLLDVATKLGIQFSTLYASTEIPYGVGANEFSKFLQGMGIGAFSTLGDSIIAYATQATARARVFTSPIAMFTSAWTGQLLRPTYGYAPSIVPPMVPSRGGSPPQPLAPMAVLGEPIKRNWGYRNP